jgi:hypothetical protein
MTPAERIAQLMAERAVGTISTPRRPIVRARTHYVEPSPVDPVAGRCLPERWRKITDDWNHYEPRRLAIKVETKIAAWAIARCLGTDWRYEPDGNRECFKLIHRNGYGMHFRRLWQDVGRFRISPLRRYRRDEGPPEEITVSAARSFGSIAGDIQRRMIDAGLKDSHDKDVNAEKARRAEVTARFAALTIVARAASGQFLPRQRWQSDGYPMVEIPGGTAGWTYGDKIQIDVDLTTEQAEEVGRVLRRIRLNGYDR